MNRLKPELIRLTPETRLYQMERPIVAITGGVATGKSTATRYLQGQGFSVICADLLIKKIYKRPEILKELQVMCPEVVGKDVIDFPKLRSKFFTLPLLKSKLEELLFSFFPEEFKSEVALLQNQDFIFYDVPLLYEKNLHTLVDYSLCIYAPREIQKMRLMARDASSPSVADKILEAQMDIEEKRKKSTKTIENTSSKEDFFEIIDAWTSECIIRNHQ